VVLKGKKRRTAGLPDVEFARGELAKAKGKAKARDKGKQREGEEGEEERRVSQDPFEDNDLLGFDFGNEYVYSSIPISWLASQF
jgi:hypothetical protein